MGLVGVRHPGDPQPRLEAPAEMSSATAALPPTEVPIPRRAYLGSFVIGAVMLGATVAGAPAMMVAGGVAALLWLLATFELMTRWRVMTSAIIVCILFVPIARYDLPITLPFNMEPYRFLVMLVGIAWLLSLLAEPEAVKLPRTSLGGPTFALAAVWIASAVANLGRIHAEDLSSDVLFRFSFFFGYLLVMAVLGSVLRTRADLDAAIKVLVGCAAVVGFFTLVENRTAYNVFDHLHTVMPFLKFNPAGVPSGLEIRGSGFRVYASAQHPLALGAALMMLVPVAVYVIWNTRQKRWWLALALIALAGFATVARTGIVMLFVEALVLMVLKPALLRRVWWMIPPFLIAVNIAVPSTIGTIRHSFFPEGGLISQQKVDSGGDAGNRLSDVGPALHEASKTPLVGQGWGTRNPDKLDQTKTRKTLDDQWLGIVLETGWFGVAAWLWFLLRNVRLLASASLRDDGSLGWLLAGLSASILGFGVGMITFDAFGFPQVTLLAFILVGFGVAARNIAAAQRAAAEADPPPRARREMTTLAA